MKAVLVFSAVLALAPAAQAAEIPFANHGGIYDWRADGNAAIIVESQSHHFYRATFLSPCYELKFHDRVGFVTDARDVLDKFDSVRTEHETCQFISFDEVPKPEKW